MDKKDEVTLPDKFELTRQQVIWLIAYLDVSFLSNELVNLRIEMIKWLTR